MNKDIHVVNEPLSSQSSGGGGGGDNFNISERIAILEERSRHLATKSWVLGGVVGGMIISATLALAIAKLWLSS